MSQTPHGWTGSDGSPQDAPLPTNPTVAEWSVGKTPHPPEAVTGPAPAGPNWGLTLFGLLLMGFAAGVVATQVTGVDGSTLQQHGPLVLVGLGVAFALVGVVGMARRRP